VQIYFLDSIGVRILVASLCIGLLTTASAVTLFRGMGPGRKLGVLFTGSFFLVNAFCNFGRGIVTWIAWPAPDLFAATLVNQIYFGGLAITMVGWALGFVLLINDRLVEDLDTAEQQPDARQELSKSIEAVNVACSNMDSGVAPPGEVVVRQELERILRHELFTRSEALSRLLRFLVEESLGGRQDQLKEFVIGAEVFQRGNNFDPREDTIVRVQARNLRNKLEQYYQFAGAGDPLQIVIPKGTYAPVFDRSVPPPAVPQPEAGAAFHLGDHRSARKAYRVSRWRTAVVTTGVAVVAMAYWTVTSRPVDLVQALAVLPFANLSQDTETEYFADGLTEELIDTLGRVEHFRVVARLSAYQYKGKTQDIRKIGRELNVQALVEGSVRLSGDRLRITAALSNISDGYRLWSATYDRSRTDAISVQEEISNAVAVALQRKLLPKPSSRAKGHRPKPETYNLYLKGRYFWNKNSLEDIRTAEQALEEVVARDPAFAEAWAMLAMVRGAYGVFGFVPGRESWPKVEEAVNQSLRLDESTIHAHTMLAGAKAYYEWDHAAADWEYRRALALAPNDAVTHQYYASFLGSMGRWQDAHEHMKLARQLDPASLLCMWGEAQLYYWEREYSRSWNILKRMEGLDPQYWLTYTLEARIYYAKSRYEEMARLLEAHRDILPRQYYISLLGQAHAALGRTAEAQRSLEELTALAKRSYVRPQSFAAVYAGLGDKEKAIERLEKEAEERGLRPGYLVVDPSFDSLRPHPRFQTLLAKVHLLPER
jgi:TolB-like protein